MMSNLSPEQIETDIGIALDEARNAVDAVAAQNPPLNYTNTIVALDEGLGTGDKQFYEKAQNRLNNFLNNSGSLFIASHSTELLRKFCLRGIVFSGGKLIFDGKIEEALSFYEEYDH